MRKVVGAKKSQLIWQFLGESLFFSFLALLVSLLIVDLFLPVLSSLLEKGLTLNLLQNLDLLLIFLSITVFVGLFSGSYPAFLVSSFQPIQIIKGTMKIGSRSSSLFRNSLVVIQFVVSIILLVCTFVIHKQLNYISTRDIGFDREQIVTIYTMDMNLKRNPEPFKNKLLEDPNILGVSASLDLPTTIRRSLTVEWDSQGERKAGEMNYTFVDYDFFSVYDIDMEKGRSFSAQFPADKTQAVVLNETAANVLDLEDPIGKRIFVQGQEWTVIGVTKDFNYESLHWKIDPLVFAFYENRGLDYFSVKVRPTDIPKTLASIEEKWNTFSPEFPFQSGFLDERMDKIYQAEKRMGKSFNVFTLLALIIACLGLFGLASFLLEQKRKEIGIRKILGAKFQNIIVMLSKEYLRCLALAAMIAWPIGYLVMKSWLQNFVYKAAIGFGIFLLSSLIAFVFALITVSYKSMKAAVSNPADSLRYE
jgi:putative ABC transport system permease protein